MEKCSSERERITTVQACPGSKKLLFQIFAHNVCVYARNPCHRNRADRAGLDKALMSKILESVP